MSTIKTGIELYAPWKYCVVCGHSSRGYFDGNINYPVCSHACEQQLTDDINEQLSEAAEASEEK